MKALVKSPSTDAQADSSNEESDVDPPSHEATEGQGVLKKFANIIEEIKQVPVIQCESS